MGRDGPPRTFAKTFGRDPRGPPRYSGGGRSLSLPSMRAPALAAQMIERTLEKLESWSWDAAVIGLGYVGLPLVVTMARAGINVVGYDVDPIVVEHLASGRSHLDDVTAEDLAEVAPRTRFTTEPSTLASPDVLFICVPTPLAVGKQPDVSFITGAAEEITHELRAGHVVILESTTYPGTTESTVLPILERSGLALDKDFLLAYSPERVDPGNASFRTSNIPRVVGGASEASTKAAELVYLRFVEKVHVVPNARTAEMAKLLENTFRWVNIALVNELSFVARAIGVNIWDVIEAAATKPFGFMPFYPGPGVGGHCIPLDPFYLQWAAPALECIRGLLAGGAAVTYADPHVPSVREHGVELDAAPLTAPAIGGADCVLILTDHDAVDYNAVAQGAQLVVDTRNALGRRGLSGGNVRAL